MIVKQKVVKKVLRKTSPRDTITKAFNKCAKALKTQLILKITKKLQELKSSEEEDAGSLRKKDQLLEKLKVFKAIDHQKMGLALAAEKFPSHFEGNDSFIVGEIDETILRTASSHKKVDQCVSALQQFLSRKSPSRNSASRSSTARENQSQSRKRSNDEIRSSNGNDEVSQEYDIAMKLKKSKLSHAGKVSCITIALFAFCHLNMNIILKHRLRKRKQYLWIR